MQFSELGKTFWEQGYLVVENHFDSELMDRLNNLILDHYGDSPEFYHEQEFLEKAKTEVIPWFPQREGVQEFDAIDLDPDLERLTSEILGDGWYSDYSMVMYSRRGTQGQSWHQDCAPEDPACFNMNRLVYTMDVTEEIGGQTLIVPGSHKMGTLPSSSESKVLPASVSLSPSKGTLVLLHGHAWHRVLPVHGDYRVSTNYRSAPKNTPQGITDICVYQNMRYQFSTNLIVEERG